VTPHSSPQYPIATSASHQAFGHQPSYAVTQRAKQAPGPGRSRALIIVVPAVVIGVVIGVALGFGGSKDTAAVANADKAMPATATTTMVATPNKAPDPAVAAAPDKTVEPAPLAQPEAAPITMPDDQVEQVGQARSVEPKPDVVALYKTAKYSEVVTTCSSSGKLVAANATQCTLAACRVKQASKAKRWFKLVGDAKKAAVLEQCAGIVTVDKPVEKDKPAVVVDPCKADPMACQH